MPALLLGSISTVADTSELQREAFNDAFASHGLDWRWDHDQYVQMLATSGGRQRIADFADARGETVDADAVHQTKSELFQRALASSGIAPRPGVVDAIGQARDAGMRVGLVTTTSPANVAALVDALSPDLGADDFDVVVDASMVDAPKPDGAAYTYALAQLGIDAAESVAVEDNVGGLEAARAAGVTCVAFPNANTAGDPFDHAAARVERLDLDELRSLAAI